MMKSLLTYLQTCSGIIYWKGCWVVMMKRSEKPKPIRSQQCPLIQLPRSSRVEQNRARRRRIMRLLAVAIKLKKFRVRQRGNERVVENCSSRLVQLVFEICKILIVQAIKWHQLIRSCAIWLLTRSARMVIHLFKFGKMNQYMQIRIVMRYVVQVLSRQSESYVCHLS